MASLTATPDIQRITSPSTRFRDPALKYSKLLTKDYTHHKLLTIAYQANGLNFNIKTKGVLTLRGAHLSSPKPKTTSQVKITTTVNGRDIEAKFTNRGIIRVWSNLGTLNYGRPITLTGKVKTDTKFDTLSYYAGLQWRYKQFDFWTRLHMKNGGHSLLSEKVIYNHAHGQLGGIYKLSLATFLFSKINIFGTYKYKDYNFYVEHAMNGNGLSSFKSIGKTTLATTFKAKRYEYIGKLVHRGDHQEDKLRLVLGTVAKFDDKTVLKAKVDNRAKVTIAGKYTLNKNLTILAGTQVRLTDPSSFTTTTVVPIPLGLSLKLSYE